MHDTEVHVQRKPEEYAGLEIDPDPKLEEEAEETAQRVMADGKLDIQRLEQGSISVQRAMGAGDREGGSMPATEDGGGPSSYQQNRSGPSSMDESGPDLELAVDEIDEVTQDTIVENQQKIISDLKTVCEVATSSVAGPLENTAVDLAAAGANALIPGSGLVLSAIHNFGKSARESGMMNEGSDYDNNDPFSGGD